MPSNLSFRAALACALLFGVQPMVAAQPTGAELEARVGEILHTTCGTAGCHAAPTPQMNLDLRRGQFLAAVGRNALTRPDLQLIHPGRPEASYLVMKVEGAEGIVGMRMPFEGDPLPAEDVETIKEWIRQLGDEQGEAVPREPPPQERYAYLGWRSVNLPTNRPTPARTLVATIGHRFNPRFDTGYSTFFGLDGSSIILLALAYAPTDRSLVMLGRSNVQGDVEIGASYVLLAEQARGPPVSLGFRATLNWLTDVPADSDRAVWTGQIILTRSLAGDRGGVSIVPGLMLNPQGVDGGGDPLLTLGLAGRWGLGGRLSLVGEWVPIVAGYTPSFTFGNRNRFDSWGGALEIATAGHVFQIVISNSAGIATDQYLRGGDLDLRRAHFRLGFNIFRVFNV